ncbi:MAG TPA: DUF3131 domain-containing protein [Gemmatimonadaceae bacterium]|nr:DUF3131 domain-containing protein [Gemmatimonadaceae bacterium]
MIASDRAPDASPDEQRRVMDQSARTAWNYVRRNYSSSSGMVKALDTWDYVTIWDIASAAAAYYSAHGLKLIDDADYHGRMSRLLATLETMPLYDGAAFNKQYASRSGSMVDRSQHVSTRGFGWSAMDMGRFLIWMKIIAATDPELAPAATRVVQRLDLKRLIANGYLNGANIDVDDHQHHEYQEGRIGYEQYSAEGFALWGARADKALDFAVNGVPAQVLGVNILADRRGDDLLTSEPFIMMGMELGWPNATWEQQAHNVLAAQRARFEKTGTMTMLSEDAVPVKPAYFYYYLLHDGDGDFVVRSPLGDKDSSYPRWISAKAAFGWHALFPSDYTWNAVRAVLPAGRTGNGWNAGVYERSKRPTPAFNLNTAALVLEAAYYAQRGCPLIRPSCS